MEESAGKDSQQIGGDNICFNLKFASYFSGDPGHSFQAAAAASNKHNKVAIELTTTQIIN
eukprot:5800247-Ditylum_brightwellii.AAC.1